MNRSVKLVIVGAALSFGLAATAYADQPANGTHPWGPKPGGGPAAQSAHFQKPDGYDQNPNNFPYTRKGVLKAN